MSIEEKIKNAKQSIEAILEFCDTIEDFNGGTKKYIPDSSTKEITMLGLKLFCLYIASADGVIEKVETDLIRKIISDKDSHKNLCELAEKSGATKDEFGDQLPLILNCAIDCDNAIDKNKLRQIKELGYFTSILYQIYASLGAFIIVSDDSVTQEEYNRLLRFMQTMYKKIKSDLDKDLNEILSPASAVSSALSQFDVSYEEISMLKRKNKSTNKKSTKPKEGVENTANNQNSNGGDEEEATLEELLDELNNLVGLNEVKYEVTSLINLCRVKQIREENGLAFPPLSLHLVFSGNPGTGKTTIARLLAKIYKKIGVLSKGHLVEVDRSGLVGGYVGQTALKVQDVIKAALGGVLFIDEAYALTNLGFSNDYGIEAVDTLVKAMEDNRDDLIVIVAGYPEPMKNFIKANPGLKSRFNKYIYFQDYDASELVEVFKLFCKQAGYRASLDALKCVREHFEEVCASKPEDFANAREVRNLFEQAMMRQANRIIMVSDVKEETLTLLKAEDILGRSEAIGKSEQMAQIALRGMSMDTRMGMPGEIMACPLDELELPVRALSILTSNNMKTLGDMITCLECGKRLEELEGMNEFVAQDIYEKIQEYGFEEE